MSNSVAGAVVVPAVSGLAMGVFIVGGVMASVGKPLLPTTETVVQKHYTHAAPLMGDVQRGDAQEDSGPVDPAQQTYTMVCGACHQANGKGLPGAFPPLAGSDWITADPETPIRIVLKGLKGEIEVAGQKFNSVMPPPPGLDDEKIAAALTYARKSFGNQASAIEAAQVAAIRAELAARTDQWTASELQALRPATGGAQKQEPAAPQ